MLTAFVTESTRGRRYSRVRRCSAISRPAASNITAAVHLISFNGNSFSWLPPFFYSDPPSPCAPHKDIQPKTMGYHSIDEHHRPRSRVCGTSGNAVEAATPAGPRCRSRFVSRPRAAVPRYTSSSSLSRYYSYRISIPVLAGGWEDGEGSLG